MKPSRVIGVGRLLDLDPDLAQHVDPGSLERARQACTAVVIEISAGAWSPLDGFGAGQSSLGYLLLQGWLSQRVELGRRCSTELLGTGDVFRPWPTSESYSQVLATTAWRALTPSTLAVLDRGFQERATRWPDLLVALLDRGMERSRSLALRLAIAQTPRLAARLHLVLWHLADRWGRVGSDGMILGLPLSHQTLADLACAQRPSVTNALRELADERLVLRRPDGGWLLTGRAPCELYESPADVVTLPDARPGGQPAYSAQSASRNGHDGMPASGLVDPAASA